MAGEGGGEGGGESEAESECLLQPGRRRSKRRRVSLGRGWQLRALLGHLKALKRCGGGGGGGTMGATVEPHAQWFSASNAFACCITDLQKP